MTEEYVDVILVLAFWGCIIAIIFGLGMMLEAWKRNKVIDELEAELHVAQNRIDELEGTDAN